MADESSMNHQLFGLMRSARPQSCPSAAFSMTIPARGRHPRGRPSGACMASCRSVPFPDSTLIPTISASFVRMRPYDSGVADETRHTVGTRVWGRAAAWDYDIEGIFQFGDFGTRKIRAWSVASDTGYTIANLWGQPRLGLRADVASGGGSGRTLKSFNPLFPKLAYFTEATINAPINFIDVFPSVTVQPWRNFAVSVGIDVLWRYSVKDGFYQAAGVPLVPGSANKKRFLGAQFNFQTEWQATSHISVNAAYVHFLTEGFLRAAGAKDIDFVGVWASYK